VKKLLLIMILLPSIVYGAGVELTGKVTPKGSFVGMVDDDQVLDSEGTPNNILMSNGTSFLSSVPTSLYNLLDHDGFGTTGGVKHVDWTIDQGGTNIDSNNVPLAATATALAVNPSDCGANNYATTIAANGDLTCQQPSEADISDLNHTATAITDDLIINADLNIDVEAVDDDILVYDSTGDNFTWKTCAEITGSADLCDGSDDGGGGGGGDSVTVAGTGADTTANFVDDGDIDFTLTDGGAGGPDDIKADIDAGIIDGDNLNSNIAGYHLTLDTASPDSLNVSGSLAMDTKCMYVESPATNDDFNSIWIANGFAVTIDKVWCESDGGVNTMLQLDDGSPASVDGTAFLCDSTPAEDEALDGDINMGDGERLDYKTVSIPDDATYCSICWTYRIDE